MYHSSDPEKRFVWCFRQSGLEGCDKNAPLHTRRFAKQRVVLVMCVVAFVACVGLGIIVLPTASLRPSLPFILHVVLVSSCALAFAWNRFRLQPLAVHQQPAHVEVPRRPASMGLRTVLIAPRPARTPMHPGRRHIGRNAPQGTAMKRMPCCK